MIKPIDIDLEKRNQIDKVFKRKFPHLLLEYSPAFRHYYITNKETKEKSTNISAYELYIRLFRPI
jgi:hypothetical protein